MAAQAATKQAQAPFRLGLKEIHLPNFVVQLNRNKSLPATQANFTVPLWFSKLDLRDYLYNAYNVRIGPSVRSYVKLTKMRRGMQMEHYRPQRKRWHRGRSTKHMTVDLERPFVWPELPEDWSAWNKDENVEQEKEQKAMMNQLGSQGDAQEVSEKRRTSMREQAKALLEGKEKWKPAVKKAGGTYQRR